MPNKKGGKKYKKGGRKNNYSETELIIKDKNQSEEYGIITNKNGNGRFNVKGNDGLDRLGIISGKMRKRVWIEIGDVVLLSVWEFQEEKCTIIHKYTSNDLNKLIEQKEIDKILIQNTNTFGDDINDSEDYFNHSVDSDDPDSDDSDIESDTKYIDSKFIKKTNEIDLNEI